mgnify:CR=1 FL=1
MTTMRRLLLVLLMLFAPAAAQAQGFDHGGWDALVKRHVVDCLLYTSPSPRDS